MNKKMSKRQRDLKSKLMAAICMLLVSSIMMVSSTYAWFTLSTAPEVTGIQTAVGANGNLEMALLPESGALTEITSEVGDSSAAAGQTLKEANVTWGNLVDLSETTTYGLDKITLFPAALNIDGDILGASLLKIPEYGADGRVTDLVEKPVTGVYDGEKFLPDADGETTYGVRAVGTASGMTPRQLAYRNANSAAATAKSQAASAAAAALNDNGSALANVAIKYGTSQDAAKFNRTDLEALRGLIDDIKANDGPLKKIETAYMQYILAYAASSDTTEELAWQAVEGLIKAEGATLNSVVAGLTGAGAELPEGMDAMIASYNGMVTQVNAADTALEALEDSEATEFSWAEIRSAMEPLVNPSLMKVNGILASDLKEKLGELVSSVTAQGGLTVTMETGAGVFATIADHTQDYSASVTIEEVTYSGITLNNMTARMATKTSIKPSYLDQVGAAVSGKAPAGAAQGEMPITDMYGYVIDLAFRTNAADSKLLLQQDAVDRIYSDNTNEATMGHGATMTFQATTPDFSNEQVKELMDCIRIVFFNPEDRNVIAYAKLDAANATSGADGWTAEISMYDLPENGGKTYEQEDYVANSGKTYYTMSVQDDVTYDPATDPSTAVAGTLYVEGTDGAYVQEDYVENSGKTYYVKNTTQKNVYTAVDATAAASAPAGTLYVETEAKEVLRTDNVIMPLIQNTATKLSALVYLDGNKVTNADVAATAATSMTGKMSLQFSSSATLVPMEYADLHTPGAAGATTESSGAATESTGG